LRVLHISSVYWPDQIGGAELMVSMLAEMQAAEGHEVAVACISRNEEPPASHNAVKVYRTGYGTPYFILDREQHSKFDRLRYKIAAKINPYAVKKMAAAILDFKPDIVNTHSLSELPPQLWPMVKRLGVPLVHTLHDFKSICSKGSMFQAGKACDTQHFKCRLLSYPHHVCQSAVDAVTGVGTEILKRHLDAGLFQHIPQELRRVIWNPIDFAPRTRKRMRAADADIVFGFLGRIEPSKGVDVLLEACRKLPTKGWRLLVAGRAIDGLERYRGLADGLPVDFIGFAERDDFFDQIDCLVVPSVWPEAFGRTVAEAYAREVPVIGSKIGGIAEQIGEEQQEWLFPAGDPAALALTMTDMLKDPARLLRKTAAMNTMAARVAPDYIAARYFDLYTELLEKSASRRGSRK
jgi:glycosyltransferase involved in cell wall biosynthesis